MSQKARAFIGAGANLGEPVRQIRQALDELEKSPGVRLGAVSSFYRTQPMGPVEQPPFINAVFSLECGMSAQDCSLSFWTSNRKWDASEGSGGVPG